MPNSIQIGERRVGPGYPVYVIAEAGLNHGGDLDIAVRMVEAAAQAGADAIKFQAFDTDSRFGDDDATKALVRPAEFGRAQFARLAAAAREHGIDFVSTAFDEANAGMLSALGAPAIKVASCDIANAALLKAIAGTGRPAILSRGTAGRAEIDGALLIFRAARVPVVLLHCVSSYPLRDEDANLAAIHSLRDAYDVPIGYSDHTIGVEVPLYAVYAGACVLEKHFTLDRERRGIDWEISADPEGLARLVAGVRRAERILGHGRIEAMPCEEEELRYRTAQRTSRV